jgi:hypothetical protein
MAKGGNQSSVPGREPAQGNPRGSAKPGRLGSNSPRGGCSRAPTPARTQQIGRQGGLAAHFSPECDGALAFLWLGVYEDEIRPVFVAAFVHETDICGTCYGSNRVAQDVRKDAVCKGCEATASN